jgi:bacillithiol system protein YtxJ
MNTAVMARMTLPERFFPLAAPADVDRLLDGVEWCAIFKAATSERTFEAWELVQKAFEPRADVAVGLVQIPTGRAASDHLAARAGVVHKSPQLLLLQRGRAVAHLDERAIQPEPLAALIREHLPAAPGPRVVNPDTAGVGVYRTLLERFVAGELPEERFQWAFLERLEKEAAWRDDGTFALLNTLFDNPWGRDLRAARVVAREFQGQLAGRLEPLPARAARVLDSLAHAERGAGS